MLTTKPISHASLFVGAALGLLGTVLLLNAQSCSGTLLECNRWLMVMAMPMYVLMALVLTTISTALVILAFIVTSLLYSLLLHALGTAYSRWKSRHLTKSKHFEFRKLSTPQELIPQSGA